MSTIFADAAGEGKREMTLRAVVAGGGDPGRQSTANPRCAGITDSGYNAAPHIADNKSTLPSY